MTKKHDKSESSESNHDSHHGSHGDDIKCHKGPEHKHHKHCLRYTKSHVKCHRKVTREDKWHYNEKDQCDTVDGKDCKENC